MAKTKINTLEKEIGQQSEFFIKAEENYERQIQQLRDEIGELRTNELNWDKDFKSLLTKNSEL